MTLILYKSLVLPHFDYCDILYMHTSLYNLNKLQYIQNSVCRIILLADKETRIVDMHRDLQLDLLVTRIKVHLSIFNHHNVYPEVTTALSALYVPVANLSKRQTRKGSTMCMSVPAVRSCISRKATSFIGPCSWWHWIYIWSTHWLILMMNHNICTQILKHMVDSLLFLSISLLLPRTTCADWQWLHSTD